jgi:hypothetical protein
MSSLKTWINKINICDIVKRNILLTILKISTETRRVVVSEILKALLYITIVNTLENVTGVGKSPVKLLTYRGIV